MRTHTIHTQKPTYSREAVQNSIDSSNRHGRKISRRESNLIHSLLRGWEGQQIDSFKVGTGRATEKINTQQH